MFNFSLHQHNTIKETHDYYAGGQEIPRRSCTSVKKEDKLISKDSIKLFRLDSLREASLSNLQSGKIDYVEYYKKALKIDSSNLLARVNHAYSLAPQRKIQRLTF